MDRCQYCFAQYLHGISHQIFPVIFSKPFEDETYEDVVRNLYERYGVLLIGVHSTRSRSAFQGGKPVICLAPFQSYIKEGYAKRHHALA